MTGKATWTIGGDPACDLVADRPQVSGRHCRLERLGDGTYRLEDLGSTNGTWVNGRRLRGPEPVRRSDVVTLGLSTPMPWPDAPPAAAVDAPPGRVITVGRDPANDVVIDSPEVSARHARVTVAPGGRGGEVEDLGSTNGTAVGSPANRAARSPFGPGDVLYFGPVAVPAATFFGPRPEAGPEPLVVGGPVTTVGRDPSCDRVVDFPTVSGRHARFVRGDGGLTVEDLGSANGTFVNGRRVERTSPVFAGDLIGLGSHRLRLVDAPPVPASPDARPAPRFTLPWAAVAVGLAGVAGLAAEAGLVVAGGPRPVVLFGLSVAAVWAGATSALAARLVTAGAGPGGEPAAAGLWKDLGLAALIDLPVAALLVGAASARFPFAGGWTAALGVVWLTAAVGSALGLALLRVVARTEWALAAAAALTALMATVGGPARPLPAWPVPARGAAAALPARWSFEALLLVSAGDVAADPYFPADTDRAGTTACTTALLAMLGGLVYLDAATALNRRPSAWRAPPPA